MPFVIYVRSLGIFAPGIYPDGWLETEVTMIALKAMPEFALGPDIPESGFVVTDLGDGAYGVTQGMVNTMFLEARNGVLLVDAPLHLGGDKLLAAIESVTSKPLTHLIYSHAHADHLGAAHQLKRNGLQIIAHERTGQFIEAAHDYRRPPPNVTFSGPHKALDIDGTRFVLDYTGDWHMAGNLFIHVPERRLFAAIDSFTPNPPFFRLVFSAHVPAYFEAMDQMLEYDFDTIVTGHMALYGTREDVVTNREYINDLRRSATEAIQTVDLKEAAAAARVPSNNKQAELKVWMEAVVARAAELMPSWDKRLGGTDIFLADNLNAVAWSVFID
ncbi:MBL fold metallo-hydrolase [Dactylosporangium sp. AC04546]|uniref:MBL fold metallo-hydrolase n=1 Tax=Dactylosporangium sp. AC04546 TaxID=2862460 RepID=UPI001EDD229B|nr:MBL fold metallo-hydrolase [Dactylosporangium sp. AC04546]WVK88903.1 MBL fold metallo-hydrolase [Dactylosporangium sp. AC04546]